MSDQFNPEQRIVIPDSGYDRGRPSHLSRKVGKLLVGSLLTTTGFIGAYHNGLLGSSDQETSNSSVAAANTVVPKIEMPTDGYSKEELEKAAREAIDRVGDFYKSTNEKGNGDVVVDGMGIMYISSEETSRPASNGSTVSSSSRIMIHSVHKQKNNGSEIDISKFDYFSDGKNHDEYYMAMITISSEQKPIIRKGINPVGEFTESLDGEGITVKDFVANMPNDKGANVSLDEIIRGFGAPMQP